MMAIVIASSVTMKSVGCAATTTLAPNDHSRCGPGLESRAARSRKMRRRSCGTAGLPNRNAELLRLVGQVGRDARARKHDQPDRQDGEHLIVALEGGGLGMAGPVGLECDLRDLAGRGPAGGDPLRALRAAAMQ